MATTERRDALTSLRNDDMGDREVLLILDELSSSDGWADAKSIRERLGLQGENAHRSVSSRLSWLTRYGAVEQEALQDEYGNLVLTGGGRRRMLQRWRLTPIGQAAALGQLSAADKRRLEALPDERLLVLMRAVTLRQRSLTSDTLKTLLRREFAYGTSPARALDGSHEVDL